MRERKLQPPLPLLSADGRFVDGWCGCMRVPLSYYEATDEQRAAVCNGAGPAGWGWLVPDTMYGLSIREAANIHDWMYAEGETPADRREADDLFYANCRAIIRKHTKSRILRLLRYARAWIYYRAVRRGGERAFMKGKGQADAE